jgi:hypothetical protein
MTTKLTFYLLLVVTVLFSCSQDVPNAKSHSFNNKKIRAKLTKTQWNQVDQLNETFSRKATVTFTKDGHFTKTDQFNYLGIKESVVETGKWSLDQKGKKIAIENPKTKQTTTYSIQKETENSLHLISLDGFEDLILTVP